eukprot:3379302-Ditylum_brightwellii.AAC.1
MEGRVGELDVGRFRLNSGWGSMSDVLQVYGVVAEGWLQNDPSTRSNPVQNSFFLMIHETHMLERNQEMQQPPTVLNVLDYLEGKTMEDNHGIE